MYNIRPMTDDDVSAVCDIENVIFSLPWSDKSFKDACIFLKCVKAMYRLLICIRRWDIKRLAGEKDSMKDRLRMLLSCQKVITFNR